MAFIWIAQTTVDSEALANRLAKGAVEEKLAACAHIDGPFQSVYLWKGAVTEEKEWRLTFKTSRTALVALGQWVKQEHSYEAPQWLQWEVEASADYFEWVCASTAGR